MTEEEAKEIRRAAQKAASISTVAIFIAAAALALAILGLFIVIFVGFRLDQRFAVFNRDSIIIRVDFAKGQKSLAVAAIFYKGGLQ